MGNDVNIGDVAVGSDHQPLIIAELSGNHNQSIDTALEMVKAAANAGVQAIKLQTYTPDSMTVDSQQEAYVINDTSSPWHGQSLYQLYQKAQTPWEWHPVIFEEARKHGLLAFSSPFDISAVDFLESLNVPAYKIASFENTDLHLIQKVASTGKPVIISTGMASVAEIDEAVQACKKEGCDNIILLKCTSTYPANPADSHLRTIPHMQQLFSCPVGLSDHTQGIGASVAGVAQGAAVIEKHFTLDRSAGGVDVDFSLQPDEMKMLVTEVKRAWQALGQIHYGPTSEEKDSTRFRRGLFVTKHMKTGEFLTEEHLRTLRPALGIPAKYFDLLIGKQVKTDIQPGTPLTWDMVL